MVTIVGIAVMCVVVTCQAQQDVAYKYTELVGR